MKYIYLLLVLISSIKAYRSFRRLGIKQHVFQFHVAAEKEIFDNSTRLKEIIRIVNKIYQPINIYIEITQLEIWPENVIDKSVEYYLPFELSVHKNQYIHGYHDCFLAFLVSHPRLQRRGFGQPLSMCSRTDCVSYVTDSRQLHVNYTAYVIAHEIGHILGLEHDTSQCGCINCIMATGIELGSIQLNWSTCSRRHMNSLLARGYASCLDKPASSTKLSRVYSSLSRSAYVLDNQSTIFSECGDGVVNGQEECDCGGGGGDNCGKCCDRRTCRFHKGQQCSTGECCDIGKCEYKAAGMLCGDPEYEMGCRLQLTCSGQSNQCGGHDDSSNDEYVANGHKCRDVHGSEGYCYHGECKSKLGQCIKIWGQTAVVANDSCYVTNAERMSHPFKNCGYEISFKNQYRNNLNWPTKQCEFNNTQCGRLWCYHSNEKSMLVAASKTYSFETLTHDICDGIKFQINWDNVDMGQVEDGIKCGSNKICVQSECVDLISIRNGSCNCYGFGTCTNRGVCKCNYGYLPPYCNQTTSITTSPHIVTNDNGKSSRPSTQSMIMLSRPSIQPSTKDLKKLIDIIVHENRILKILVIFSLITLFLVITIIVLILILYNSNKSPIHLRRLNKRFTGKSEESVFI